MYEMDSFVQRYSSLNMYCNLYRSQGTTAYIIMMGLTCLLISHFPHFEKPYLLLQVDLTHAVKHVNTLTVCILHIKQIFT